MTVDILEIEKEVIGHKYVDLPEESLLSGLFFPTTKREPVLFGDSVKPYLDGTENIRELYTNLWSALLDKNTTEEDYNLLLRSICVIEESYNLFS